MLEKVGNRIKELRIKNAQLSQEDFAKKLGVDRTYLSRVESGKQNITLNTLALICSKLKVSFGEFFATFNEK